MLYQAIGSRPVAVLLANAGQTSGHGFLDQDFVEARQVPDTNITAKLYLLHKVVGTMRHQRNGKVLITGSICVLRLALSSCLQRQQSIFKFVRG